MISDEECRQLTVNQPKSLVQLLRESPLAGIDLNLERDKDTGREVELSTGFLPDMNCKSELVRSKLEPASSTVWKLSTKPCST